MKLLVDELPKRPDECLFCSMETYGVIDEAPLRVYLCTAIGWSGKISCAIDRGSGSCPFLAEGKVKKE